MTSEPAKRTLTDADIAALVDAFNNRFEENFYRNVGKGVWRLAWIGVLAVLAALAAFGHFNFGGH